MQRKAHGFTLLELLAVISILGIIGALTMPDLTEAGRQQRLLVATERVASFLDNLRRKAVAEGRCYRVRVDDAGRLVGERRTSGDCVNILKDAWAPATPETTLVPENGLMLTLEALPSTLQPDQRLIFRPSSRLRGNNDLDVTNDEARVAVTFPNMSTQRWITVTSVGRICVRGPATTLPAFTTPVGCP